MSKKLVKATKDAMYLLLGQVEFDDFSDFDTYWANLTKAFRRIPVKYNVQLDEKAPLSKLLEVLNGQYTYVSGDVVRACRDFEDACDVGSSESVGDDVLNEIKSAAEEFENEFRALLKTLDATFSK